MHEEPKTWHHGVVARYWAEFNTDGPEIAYFRQFIERDGQPALDVACGTGRLLLPYLLAGLDVDGCDISADMIALCRERAEREGLSPNLHVQPMHELDLPRTYRTIIVCGALGLGGNREQDLEALRRLYAHLEPGGLLVMDNEVPYADRRQWRYWPMEEHGALPEPWPPPGERRRAADGTEFEVRSRIIELDPLTQHSTWEMHAQMWRDGELVAEDEHTLRMTLYFTNEVVLMLERAGFVDIALHGGHTDAPPTSEHEFVVFVAARAV